MTTVFLESLDSSRVTSEDSPQHPNLAQTQTEALINLLFGRTVSVSGAYAFDSRSFLELAEVVLDARAARRNDETLGTAGRSRLDRATPFRLNWYAPPKTTVNDLRSGCIEQLERPGFVLSGWRQINDDVPARRALAASLRTDQKPPGSLGDDLLAQFETLRRVLEYSESEGRTHQAQSPKIDLKGYLTSFAELGQADTELLAQRANCPVQLAVDLRDEIKARTGVLGSRSWAHEVILRAERYRQGGPSLPLLLRELVDTCYNAVIADSCRAAAGYMSSVPRVEAYLELKQVNAVATNLIELCRAKSSAAQPTPSPISGLLARADVVERLEPKPLSVLFDAHWQLVADDDSNRYWSDSCALLEERLDPAQGHGAALADAWASHLDLLRLHIPGLVEDGVQVAIAADHRGETYVQTHQHRRPTADELASAYSVGEYLDELSTVG